MRSLLRRLWALPWSPRLRNLAMHMVAAPGLRLLFLPNFIVGVVGIIRNERGEILLLKHTYRRRYPWGLPTGLLEYGEQPLAALRREILEETGFSAELEPMPRVYTTRHRPYVNIVYMGAITGGTFTPSSEISHAAFIAPRNFSNLEPEQAHLLRELLEGTHESADGDGP